MNYNVAIADGRVVSGIIAFESASAITLKRAQGAIDSVARDQIATIAVHGRVADARRSRKRAIA